MSDLKLKAGAPGTPCTWSPLILDEKRTARVTCGNGHIAVIDDHSINEDGKVTPSLECPHDPCGWHEYVTLLEWKEYWTGKADWSPTGKRWEPK